MKAAAAGDGMCIPSDPGDGTGTNDEGEEGTRRAGFPGEGLIMFEGDGAMICKFENE